ncbi:restriction endonuclease [Pseudomonas sp.]|uniref:restriction endonuclease n=1 Tax=Pseudomonas sp. TaxID=306 RepID=UPI002C77017A|nr:restriction endonuclease [Pseudomonas sp.]HUE93835.1 restriction endonuclease [Pseudomonas sp.]
MTDIAITLADIDFLQEQLNFSEISPVDFENLVFHLLDEMGFSNLTWRKGGEGNSATDGGRDLEATFWTVLPAVSKEEKYWFEVKYRKGQLEKSQVQGTVLNAAGNNSKDNVVIVANKTISNPTLDWIKEFQNTHKTPSVSVWQGHDLELLLRKNPRTLARFLPSSLAFSGRCKVIESKFSNLMLLPAGGELDELWNKREEYYENSYLTLIAMLAEVAYGDVVARQWGLDIDEARLFAVAATGMLNVYPFILKCSALNREQAILINGLSYIIQCLLLRIGEELTAKVLFNPEEFAEPGMELPDKLRFNRYEPIFNTIFHDLSVRCSEIFCSKVSHIHKQKKSSYFNRFLQVPVKEDEDETLILNSLHGDCRIGIVAKDEYCPLGNLNETPEALSGLVERLKFARGVIISRSGELSENA